MKIIDNWKLALLGSLTIGLAPFYPEPHLLGKIRWIIGGATGMGPLDWWDAIMHGAPWVFLIVVLIRLLLRKIKN